MVKININIKKLLKKFLPKFLDAISSDYSIGSEFTIKDAKSQGKKTNMKALNLSKQDEKRNIIIIEELVKGVDKDLSKKINYLTNKSVDERWSNEMLADELKGVFDKDSPNYFNYKNRFKTIARTETTRIMSVSANNTATRLGANKKYLFMTDDNRTSDVSRELNKKYGKEEQAITLDKPFEITVNNKNYSSLLTPIHINDRDIVLYLFE